ncbi:hypothetical protein Vadar_025396 [Vaccinium darrowii]|uniref:Uncharacterized protein n=1 Tax=Vaccinium darrowii TaxID=229202 RepID=A0ACB7Y1S5_9ERIC|nr:hypothetical protein Vadar_025396 [Vaccinium darrowii]
MMILALCLVTALVTAARPMEKPFRLEGRVYCDTCRAGFETSFTTPIAGAEVKVECKNRETQELLYSIGATTDSKGKYEIKVREDHANQLCDVMLVSSPQSDCAKPDSGRDRSRVILTGNNGISSYNRFANAMGFLKDKPLAGCQQLLQQYEQE